MKKIIMALLITLILASGCAEKEPAVPAEDNNNGNAAVNTASIKKTTAPQYFVPGAILADGSLFGMSGSELMVWHPETGETKKYGHAWWAIPSPDGQKVAFTDEQGLHVLDLESGVSVTVDQHAENSDSSLTPGVWSPDAGKLLYMFVYEWTSDYYIYNVETKEKTLYEFVNIPNFLSRPVDWIDNGLVFAVHASQSSSGEREYKESGYRSDLMLADEDGHFTPVTRMNDGQFAIYGGTTGDSRTMLAMVREEELHYAAGLVDVDSGNIEYLATEGNTIGGSIGPDGSFALLITAINGDRFNIRIFDLENESTVLEEEIAGYEPPSYFFWGKDGRSVQFGVPGDGPNGVLYTVTIQ